MRKRWLAFLFLLVSSARAFAASCGPEDFEHAVIGGDSECIVMARFGASQSPKVMVVWLHGDVSGGGPAAYHFPVARQAAERFAADGVLSIALVRPGYEDADGRRSGGTNYNRADHYTKTNMQIVGGAIDRLKQHFHPRRVVIVGHSGGSATAANLLGMMPGLTDAALLVSCPCGLVDWRANRGKRPWTRSEDPAKWLDSIQPPVRVVALTGSDDDNTDPDLARSYVERLQKRGVAARFELIPGVNHNGAFKSPMVFDALAELVKP